MPPLRRIAVVACAVPLAGLGACAADYRLRVEGIDGGPAAAALTLPVVRWSWGAAQRGAAVAAGAGTGGDDRVALAAVLPPGAKIPASICAPGRHVERVTLSGSGQRIELEDAVVTSCARRSGEEDITLRGRARTIAVKAPR
jgi:hypothetical protein